MNVKKELLFKIPKGLKIVAAQIIINFNYAHNRVDSIRTINLKVNHSKEELNNFLTELNFTYNHAYRGRALDGILWLSDGSWLERDSDGIVEWWQRYAIPLIPKQLI